MSVNKAILIGRLGGDPEVRYTQGGTAVANFSIATDESWTDRDGQRQERTEWHRIVAWGRLGEICGEHLSKGRQVYVEGSIQTREWQDRDGQRRFTTEIKASQVTFLGSRGDSQGRSEGYRPPQGAQDRGTAPGGQPPGDFPPDEDIPFGWAIALPAAGLVWQLMDVAAGVLA